MIEFIDKTSEQVGTALNRKNLMAVQGFGENVVNVVENEGGSIEIIETNGDNQILTVSVVENADRSLVITETFSGEKILTKTTTINAEATEIRGVLE